MLLTGSGYRAKRIYAESEGAAMIQVNGTSRALCTLMAAALMISGCAGDRYMGVSLKSGGAVAGGTRIDG